MAYNLHCCSLSHGSPHHHHAQTGLSTSRSSHTVCTWQPGDHFRAPWALRCRAHRSAVYNGAPPQAVAVHPVAPAWQQPQPPTGIHRGFFSFWLPVLLVLCLTLASLAASVVMFVFYIRPVLKAAEVGVASGFPYIRYTFRAGIASGTCAHGSRHHIARHLVQPILGRGSRRNTRHQAFLLGSADGGLPNT
jgi:hypothetical protein